MQPNLSGKPGVTIKTKRKLTEEELVANALETLTTEKKNEIFFSLVSRHEVCFFPLGGSDARMS
jgi:hypothetical protein